MALLRRTRGINYLAVELLPLDGSEVAGVPGTAPEVVAPPVPVVEPVVLPDEVSEEVPDAPEELLPGMVDELPELVPGLVVVALPEPEVP